MRRKLLLTLVVISAMASSVVATVPHLINYQGLLSDNVGDPVADASYSVVFTIYDAGAAGTSVWTETQNVNTTNGIFTVLLGSVTPLLDTVFSDTTRYLGIKVGGDAEFTPRTRIVTVPYSFRTATVDGATGGAISGDLSASGRATFGPGHTNTGANAFVAGESNVADNTSATVSGGGNNKARGIYSAVAGGGGASAIDSNSASGNNSSIGGGRRNTSSGDESTVGGGYTNKASGSAATISGGTLNNAIGAVSTIGGGTPHTASGVWCTVGGGVSNTADSVAATVGGGSGNNANNNFATVGGGANNTASKPSSTVGGGIRNTASRIAATIGGGNDNIASGVGATIGGGSSNTASGKYAAIGGGENNIADDTAAIVGGGHFNKARGRYSVVAGGGGALPGDSNSASGSYSAVGGGRRNTASSIYATVGGGQHNSARGFNSVVSGGGGFNASDSNSASGDYSAVGGGRRNIASGVAATIPGGHDNLAVGDYSFAAGRLAKANHNGAFVWADNIGVGFASTGPNQFIIRAIGGVGIGTNSPSARLHVVTTSSQTIAEFSTSQDFSYVNFGHTGTGARKWAIHTGAGNGTGTFAILDQTAGQNRLAIDITGRVGIGTITPNFRLDVRGDIGNNATLFHSDFRWKKNIETIEGALEKVKLLRGVKYEWRSEEFADMNFPKGKRLGLIAQEVEKVLPELVKTAPDSYKSVEYANLVAVLIEATKEQQNQIESQQEQINELKSLVDKLVSKTQTDVTLSKK